MNCVSLAAHSRASWILEGSVIHFEDSFERHEPVPVGFPIATLLPSHRNGVARVTYSCRTPSRTPGCRNLARHRWIAGSNRPLNGFWKCARARAREEAIEKKLKLYKKSIKDKRHELAEPGYVFVCVCVCVCVYFGVSQQTRCTILANGRREARPESWERLHPVLASSGEARPKRSRLDHSHTHIQAHRHGIYICGPRGACAAY